MNGYTVYTEDQYPRLYLDWFVNFLTVACFAAYYNMTVEQAQEIINVGRNEWSYRSRMNLINLLVGKEVFDSNSMARRGIYMNTVVVNGKVENDPAKELKHGDTIKVFGRTMVVKEPNYAVVS